MNGGAMAGTAAAAAVIQAIKASGVVVRLAPEEFQRLLNNNRDGLVVHAPGRFFSRGHKYMMGYKGLAFHTTASEPLPLPGTCQVVEAQKIWIPG